MIGVAGKGISDKTGDGGIAGGRIDDPRVEGTLAGRGANDGQTAVLGWAQLAGQLVQVAAGAVTLLQVEAVKLPEQE